MLTNSLVAMGVSAVPAIEEALDSFEAQGAKSPVASKVPWLLLAYARIKGPAVSSRLRRMIGKPLLREYAVSLDQSLALSLGLTSYVSAFRKRREHQCMDGPSGGVVLRSKPCKPASSEVPIETIRCTRGEEPRDALDKLILAWETGDQLLMGWSLGPQAKSTLDQLRMGTIKSMPARSRSLNSRPLSIGYRLSVAGRWAEPDENLVQKRPFGNLEGNYINPEIEAFFTDKAGRSCGQVHLQFSSTPITQSPDGPMDYSVNNPNIVKVLDVIAACATATPLLR
jgi:hypothetical protein